MAASSENTYEKSKETIYQQIKGQSKNLGTEKNLQTGASATKEGGLGSTDAVMRDMADRLAKAGVTSIEELGQGTVPIYQKVNVYPQYADGRAIGYDDNWNTVYERVPTGKWVYETTMDYGDSQQSFTNVVPDSEVKRLGLTKGQGGSVDLKVGEKTGYINKNTGEPFAGLEGYRGQGWGGTGAGDGQTIYDVQFDKETGLPIFFNRQRHGKDDYADLLKIAAIGTAIFAPQIGAAIAPGAAAATQLAIGSAVSGFVGSGGDLKQGIKSGLAAYLGGQAGSWAADAANSAIVGNVAGNMTRTAILGGDMDQALVSSLTQVAPQVMSQYLPDFANLPRAVQESALTAAVDLMATGGENLGEIAMMGASNAATDYAVNQIDGYKDLRPAQKEIVRTRVSNALQGKDLSNELLQGVIGFGQEAVQNELKNSKPSGITTRVVDEAIPQGGAVEQLADAGLTEADVNLPSGLQLAGSNYRGEFPGLTYDPDYVATDGSTGTYRPTETDSKTESTLDSLKNITPEAAVANTAPDWVKTSDNEKVVGLKFGSEGSQRYQVERTNPNDPTDVFTYEVVKDDQTGEVSYEYGGMSGDAMEVVNTRTPPASPWDAAEKAPEPVGPVAPAPIETPQAEPVPDVVDQLTAAGLIAPELVNPSKPAEPVKPSVTQPTATVTPAQVEKIVNDAIKANPNLTTEDVQKIVSDAVATVPNLTADQVKSIVGAEVAKVPTGATAADVKKVVDDAIASIQIPTGLTKTDVSSAISEYMKVNPNVTAADVAGAISEYMTANPGLTKTDLDNAVTAATKDFATTQDIESAIAGIQFPAGLSKEDVKFAIADYMAANPGLSLSDVASKITEATSGLATSEGVATAIGDALKGYATTKDIKDAIADIKFPAGLTEADVTSAIKTYMTENPGLSLADVASKIGDATKGLATSEGVKADIAAAVKGYATAKDVETAIANINFPAGISKEDVAAEIKTYMEANPGLSLADVASKIGEATKGLATSEGVKTDIAAAIKGLATTKDIETAIAGIKFPVGLTKEDVAAQVKAELAANPNLTAKDVTDSIAAYMTANPGLTAEDVSGAIKTAVSGLATQESLEQLQTDLSEEIQAAKDIGLKGDEAIQAGLNSLAEKVGTNQADLLTQLGTTAADLKAQFAKDLGAVTEQIGSKTPAKPTQEDVTAALQVHLGKQPFDAKYDWNGDGKVDLSDTLNLLKSSLGKPTTTPAAEDSFWAQPTGVYKEIADTKKSIEAAIADAKAAGLDGDAALKAAIDAVAADQQTSATDLLTKLGTTEANLKTEFKAGLAGVTSDIEATRTALQDAIKAAQDIGLEGDAALKAAIDSVAADQKTNAADLLTKLGTTEGALRSDMEAGLAGVTASIADTKTALEAAIADAKASGLEGDAALKSAIDAVAADQKTNAAGLLEKLGTTEAGLKSEFAAGLAGVSAEVADTRKALEDAIQAAQDIGLEGDAALQAGIESVAAELGTTKEALLGQLGTTEATLRSEMEAGLSGVATSIADTKTALEAAIAEAKAAGLEGDAALKSAIESVAADQKTNAADLLTKLGTTEAGLKTEFAAGLAGVSAEVADTRKSLEDAIQAAKDIGLEGDAALQAGIDSVASELGTTKEALLGKLGTTEETLRTEFATGITGLETQMKAQYEALTAAQKAEADARLAQGQTLEQAIAAAKGETAGQISALEAATKAQYETLTAAQKAATNALVAQGQTLADAITAAKSETAGQIADVETRLTDAIAAAEAMGLTRDQAITAAVESVAADLGTTKDALLTQLGTTEAGLRTEFTTGLAGVSAEVKAAYDSLSAEQKALANQLAQQGTDLATAIQTAQQQTQSQIGTLSADMQAKYNSLSAEQKALATDMAQQGMDLTAAINLAQQQTQAQITGLGEQVDTRINELMQQGQSYQQATQQAIGELNQQNQQLQGLVGTQGRQATQADIDALTQMLGGQRSMDLSYDVTGDKQITQDDIDFLTQVVGGVKTDWTAPVGSAFGPTGLYGQLAANEAQRQADLQAQLAREEAARQAEAERQRLAAAEAERQGKIANVRGAVTQGQQSTQSLAQQLPQAFQQAQQVSTPLYGAMEYFDPFSDPFSDPFGTTKMRTASSTNPADQTKMAAGGYIDDLLAGEMTVDDLLDLLR